MEKFFKKNNNKKKHTRHNTQNAIDNHSGGNSSNSDEEIDFPPIKSPSSSVRPRLNDKDVQRHTAVTWPRLPELALTTSQDLHSYKQVDIPIFSSLSSSSQQQFLNVTHHKRSNSMSNCNSLEITSSYIDINASDTDAYIEDIEHKRDTLYDEGFCCGLPSLASDHHKLGYHLDISATNTLVEAAMDKGEAKDRHIRFHDHVAESAALVHRMLSVRRGHQPSNPLQTMVLNRHNNRKEEEIELEKPQAILRGGSVLASLMKLEVSRHDNTATKKKKKRRSKTFNFKSNKSSKPASLLDFPVHSNTGPLTTNSSTDLPLPRPKRPKLVNRPTSWLSNVASSKYVVPSLNKHKKTFSPSFSRRSSNDSMFTTASQFEPITLEDRIRITFEIANILQKQEFLRKLCRSLMLYGCPAHRLEYAMRQVSRTLAVEAEYIYLPSVMLITFIDSTTHTTETHFIRQSTTFEMHRLADIYRLEKLVAHGEISIDEALEFIDKVYEQPAIYPLWSSPIVYALAAFTGCVMFFGGRWQEAGVCAALGMIFATNEIFSSIISSFQPIWEICVCILIGFVARGISKYGFCFTPIAFSSFIIVLPGYPMAVSIIELVSRQLVSGVVRMVYAIMYSFLLGYGITMGSELYLTIDKSSSSREQSDACKLASSSSTCVSSEPQVFNFMLVPLFALAYCVYLRARLPRWPIMIVVSACTYTINYSLACWAHAPSQILQVAPAFGLGLIGNLLAKITGKMSFDAVLLGVFYLVPSSLGLKAAIGLFGGSDEVGNQGAGFALAMIESSIGITLGLFLATLLVYPKGTQHTPLMTL